MLSLHRCRIVPGIRANEFNRFLSLDGNADTSLAPPGVSTGPVAQALVLPSAPPVPPPVIVKTPAVLERALASLQSEMVQDHPKRFRQLGKALVKSIKMKSLSKHRGGLQPNFFDSKRGPRSVFRGSSRQQERRALKDLAHLGSSFEVAADGDLDSIKRVMQSHPSYEMLKHSAEEYRMRVQTRDLVPSKLYNGLGALAYATARLPSTYAAVRNVFQRLKMSQDDPNWSPGTMLDFGAGPGTAAWAARAIWPSARVRVTSVEGSASMADIGYRIQRLVDDMEHRLETTGSNGTDVDTDFGTTSALDVRWVRGLPRERVENRYDVCVASYSLNELRSQVERHQLLNRLIRSATEYIVLIEHGTPHGFAIIEDSRRYVLNVSRKLGMPFHVAAPCPHDGPCPLRDKRAWCHFSQRHLRTVEQRVAVKSLTGNAPRDAYTERFSYVVLKRGLRQGLQTSMNRENRTEFLPIADRAIVGSGESVTAEDQAMIVLQDVQQSQTPSQEAFLGQVRNSRILRRRKRKGHVMLDLCSVLDADGTLIADGAGTILRQIVSKGKSKSSWDGGAAYKASKALSQGDEWPLLFQAKGNAIETPVMDQAWRGVQNDHDGEGQSEVDDDVHGNTLSLDDLAFLFEDDDETDDETDDDVEGETDDVMEYDDEDHNET